jgi:hypothetical protein
MDSAPKLLLSIGCVALLLSATMGAALVGAVGPTTDEPLVPGEVEGIPQPYLEAYARSAARFELGPDGWSYLAAVGKFESDHGRSPAPGVRSGQNSHGCCAGPMQIHNGFGSGGGTWGAYKVDGDGDGREDIYDPDDAIATGARYLGASGAPDDWRRALFSYNHAGWYVDQVLEQAAAYRTAAGPATTEVEASGSWLVDVPGQPGERCDRRIVADVVMLLARFGLTLTDCYGGSPPHDRDGEHPLGLATDLVPKDGNWNRTLSLVKAYGWSPACAANGCAGRGPFRVVLYNGYPGHGDPQHGARFPHLHLSWQHAPAEPFTAAAWVRVLLAPGASR